MTRAGMVTEIYSQAAAVGEARNSGTTPYQETVWAELRSLVCEGAEYPIAITRTITSTKMRTRAWDERGNY